jgi:cytoskeletal protein RodZ
MTQLGERFRQAREARGLSITDVSTATRILPRYLHAIEAGDVASLPGDVYARGFIRNYAQLLGLPPEEMIALYRQERGEPTSRIKVAPVATTPRTRSCLIPSFFVTFFTVLLLLAGLYFVLSSTGMLANRREEANAQTATPVPPTPTTFPTPTLPPENTTQSPLPPPTGAAAVPVGTAAGGAPPEPNASSAAPTAAATPEAPVVVVATVLSSPPSQGSWFTVTQDGAAAFNALLRPGRSQTFRGQREIFLNIGDTSVVQLTVNGQPFPGLPGAVRGVPRRVTCTPQGCS